MKHFSAVLFAIAATASTAQADFSLANNGKKVVCTADDNQSWTLNAARTTVKYVVEGESRGALKITAVDSDGDTYLAYTTPEGTLVLGDEGDTYRFADDEDAFPVECR